MTGVVGRRIIAQTIDTVFLLIQLLAITLGLTLLFRVETDAGFQGMFTLSLLTLPLYGGVLEWLWNGQTVGKRLTGIQIVDVDYGTEPAAYQAFIRNIPAVVWFSWITAAVALAAMAMSDRRQRVFDWVAGTCVIRFGSTVNRQQSEDQNEFRSEQLDNLNNI
ncbi:RDD family protein [Natronorubrum sp. DTA7]|uniref:RDD family protein n=1 Tax=Natronorubrum sp. DTA7 TaxID=3447016 RepID=UPI003F8425F0